MPLPRIVLGSAVLVAATSWAVQHPTPVALLAAAVALALGLAVPVRQFTVPARVTARIIRPRSRGRHQTE